MTTPPIAVVPIQAALGVGLATLVVALWAAYRRAARPTVPGVSFGVTVPADWPDSPAGRAVVAAYDRRVAVASVAAIAAAAAGAAVGRPTPGWTLLIVAGPVAQSLVATAAYLAGRRTTLPQAVPAGSIRRASLEAGRAPTVGGWVTAQLGPVAVLAASAVFLAAYWPAIPDRMPTHFDVTGRADQWSARSVLTVYWPPAVGLLTCGLIFAVGVVTIRDGRRPRGAAGYQSAVLGLTLVGEYTAAAIMSAVSWTPALHGTRWSAAPLAVAMGVTPVLAVAIGYFVVRRWPHLRGGDGGDGTPDACWRWGLIYSNPADPAVLVPKRFGFGYTFNFARGTTWALLAGMAAFVAAIVAVPLLVGRG